MRHHRATLLLVCLAGLAAASPPDCVREVKPALAERCYRFRGRVFRLPDVRGELATKLLA